VAKSSPVVVTRYHDDRQSRFQNWYLASAYNHLRPVLILCIICGLFASSALLTFLPRETWAGVAFFHLGFIIFPLLMILGLSYRAEFPHWISTLSTTMSISALIGTNGLIGWCYLLGVWMPYEGTMLLAFAIGMFSSLPIKRVALILMFGWLLFAVISLTLSREPLVHKAMNIMFLLFASLIAIVTAGVLQRFLRSEYRRQVSLEELSETDPLTGLLNRRGFGKRFDLAGRNALREKRTCGLLLLDVDYFKNYNDHYGHDAGDLVLQKLGQVLMSFSQRPFDAAARLGGEEFGLLLHDADESALREIGHNLCRRIAELGIPHSGSECASVVTASIGATVLVPGQTRQQAYRSADHALYAAKKNGRNQSMLTSELDVRT